MLTIKYRKRLPSGYMVALGFGAAIAFGTILLMLPFALRSSAGNSFSEAFLTAAAALGGMGISTPLAQGHFSRAGHLLASVMMLAGGVGITFAGIGLFLTAEKWNGIGSSGISIRELQRVNRHRRSLRLMQAVLLMTLSLEAAGAAMSLVLLGGQPGAGRTFLDVLGTGAEGFPVYPLGRFTNAGLFVLCVLMYFETSRRDRATRAQLLLAALFQLAAVLGMAGYAGNLPALGAPAALLLAATVVAARLGTLALLYSWINPAEFSRLWERREAKLSHEGELVISDRRYVLRGHLSP